MRGVVVYDHLIENLKNMSVDEGYETDEDLLDVDDIGKASDFPLTLYFPDDELSKSNEINNISSISQSPIYRLSQFQFFLKEYNSTVKSSNDLDLKNKIASQISNFINSNDGYLAFPKSFSKEERCLIHEVAESFNLKHFSTGESPDRQITI